METEPLYMYDVENEAFLDESHESDNEDCQEASFKQHPINECYENDPEDYKGASFDDAFHDLQHPQEIEWPNDIY
jgi:hypothetical protein